MLAGGRTGKLEQAQRRQAAEGGSGGRPGPGAAGPGSREEAEDSRAGWLALSLPSSMQRKGAQHSSRTGNTKNATTSIGRQKAFPKAPSPGGEGGTAAINQH